MLLASTAHAQAYAPQGPGIRLGDVARLHLGLGIGFLYDSNVFYESSHETGAFALVLSPSIAIDNQARGGRRQIDFQLHAGLGYTEYLTSDSSVSKHRQFNVDAGAQVWLFPQLRYNVVFFDNFVRTTQPPYIKSTDNFDRDNNELGARLNLSPGGGRLTLSVGYLFGIDFFEREPLKAFDLFYHRIDVRGSWRFFPKTAVYLAVNETINTYRQHYDYQPPMGMTTGPVGHVDSYPLRIDAGLRGLITAKLTLDLYVGYGNGFYASGPSPNTALGGVEATWKPLLTSTGTLGYRHDFVNALLGSYYDLDMVYVSWTQLIWRFLAYARFSYDNDRYNGIQASAAINSPNRSDHRIVLNTRVDYAFKDWLSLGIGYDLQYLTSNAKLSGGAVVPVLTPVDYLKHTVYLRLNFAY